MKYLDGVSYILVKLFLIVGEKYMYHTWEGIPDNSVCTLEKFNTTNG